MYVHAILVKTQKIITPLQRNLYNIIRKIRIDHNIRFFDMRQYNIKY